MADHSAMKLGCISAPQHPLIHPVSMYATMAPPPPESNWYAKIGTWPMFANDTVGDCTCAAIGHVIQQWTAFTDVAPVVMTDAEVLQVYSGVTGYIPGVQATDRGALITDALRYWMMTGIPTPSGDDVLDAVAAVRPHDVNDVCRAIATFGNVLAGVELPLSAQTENVWTATTDAPGSWGGHCVPLVGYNRTGPLCVTWGALKQMTWDWWATYANQAYVLLSRDWLSSTGYDPESVDWDGLEDDFRKFSVL